METYYIVTAAHWASYLINGDDSSLDDSELKLARDWMARELGEGDCIVDCSEPYFSWHYDMHTGDCRSQGGNVTQYTVIRS